MASAPFCHDVRTQKLSYWTATPRLSIVAPAYRFAIGHPLQYTGLLLATHDRTGLPLSLPHCSVSVHTFTRSGDSTVLSHSDTSLADVSSCHRGCVTSATWPWPGMSRVIACGIATSLGACSSQTSIFFNLHTVLLFYQTLQPYATCAIHQSTRLAHKSLVFSDRHLYSMYFPAHRWTERGSH